MTVIHGFARRGISAALSWARRYGLFVIVALVLALLTPRLLVLKDSNVVLCGYIAMMLMVGVITRRPSGLWLVLIPTWVTTRTIAADLPSPETATGDFGASGPIMVLAVMVPLILGIMSIIGGIFARRGTLRLVSRFHLPLPRRA